MSYKVPVLGKKDPTGIFDVGLDFLLLRGRQYNL